MITRLVTLVWLLGLAVLAFVVSGCVCMPDYVEPEIEHMSHATQHQPFTANPTEYGAEIASVVVGWDVKNVSIQLAEGLELDKHYAWDNSNGEIIGPREQFSARVGYKFMVHK